MVERGTERRTLEYVMRFRPASLVRGSSRRIMSMKASPARSSNISMINRRLAHLDHCPFLLIATEGF